MANDDLLDDQSPSSSSTYWGILYGVVIAFLVIQILFYTWLTVVLS